MARHAVFAYGTLQIPSIMNAVTGRSLAFEPGRLPGYARFRIKQQVFPGIIPDAGQSVPGVVYKNVDDAVINLLDRFEDELYERCTVAIVVGGYTLPAEAYVVAGRYRKLLEKVPWSLEQFRRKHLQDYLCSCQHFYSIQQSGQKPDF